jgi:transposase
MGGLVNRDDRWRIPDWLWEKVEPLLPPRPPHPLGCCRSRVPDRNAMNAILLVLRTGMQWNALQITNTCSSSSAHRRFGGVGAGRCLPRDLAAGAAYLRREGGHRLVLSLRRRGPEQGAPGRRADGSQSHRSRQKGAKRSLLTEAAGVAVGLECDGANRNDHLLLKATLDSIPIERPEPSAESPQGLCLDAGYDNSQSRKLATDYSFQAHIRSRSEEIAEKLRKPGWKARRWVVEACHSWLNRNRALLIRWSKKPENHLALLQLASGLLAFKKAHRAQLAGALSG